MDRVVIEYKGKKYFRQGHDWYSSLGEKKPELQDVLNEKLLEHENDKLWVARLNDDTLVFDKRIPQPGELVTFWSLENNQFIDYERGYARGHSIQIKDQAQKANILEKYRGSAVVRHRLKLQAMGKEYSGIRYSSNKTRRETNCWSCKSPITSENLPECITCGWILCSCGACGCGRPFQIWE